MSQLTVQLLRCPCSAHPRETQAKVTLKPPPTPGRLLPSTGPLHPHHLARTSPADSTDRVSQGQRSRYLEDSSWPSRAQPASQARTCPPSTLAPPAPTLPVLSHLPAGKPASPCVLHLFGGRYSIPSLSKIALYFTLRLGYVVIKRNEGLIRTSGGMKTLISVKEDVVRTPFI